MNSPSFRRKLSLLAAALCLLVVAPAARAEEKEESFFTTSNIQVLWGGGFSDAMLGYNTKSQSMFTVTLNNYSQFKYGDSFAFIDIYQGEFIDPVGGEAGNAKVYAEWHPRLFINKFLGMKDPVLGVIGNWGIAAELNAGSNFVAYLLGAGADFFLPLNIYVGLNLYYRYSSLWVMPGLQVYENTWQLSPWWSVGWQIGPVPFLFSGFMDMYQYNGGNGVDVMFQPELVVDVLAPFGGKSNTLFAGCEWYLHSYNLGAGRHTVSAPQILVQWNVH